MTTARLPLLDELWALMEERGTEEAAARFCEAHGCHRRPATTDWKFFLPLPPGARVLEVGAGFAEDTLALSRDAALVIALVPSRQNARIVGRRLREAEAANAGVVVTDDLTRLPLPRASVDAVALEDVATPAFGLTSDRLPAAVAEFDRVLAPGGTLFYGARSGYRGLPGARSLLPPHGRESLNRTVKLGGALRRAMLGRDEVAAALRRRGFAEVETYAPLPHEQAIEAVVPLDRAAPLRYALERFLRRNSLATRAAIAAAGVALDAGLLPRLLPYSFVFFRRAARP